MPVKVLGKMNKQLTILDQLIGVAGTRARLCKLLGLRPYGVNDFKKRGQVSAYGALLVEKSKELRLFDHFKKEKMRPDISAHQWAIIIAKSKRDLRFKRMRERQVRYEATRAFVVTSPTLNVLTVIKKRQG